MRTVIDAIQTGPLLSQKIFHPLVNQMKKRFREITSCYSGLVGDDNGLEPMLV
jgi:hypothetical protein